MNWLLPAGQSRDSADAACYNEPHWHFRPGSLGPEPPRTSASGIDCVRNATDPNGTWGISTGTRLWRGWRLLRVLLDKMMMSAT